MTIVIVPPKFSDSRKAAVDLLAHTTELATVSLDLRSTISVSPDFCDQFIQEVFVNRNIRLLILNGGHGRTRSLFQEAVENNNISTERVWLR